MLFDFEFENVYKALKNADKPIVIYGMGNGADKVISEFDKRNIKISGVMASDDFVRYQDFHGFTVSRQSDFEEKFGDFYIALCFASSLKDVMAHIEEVNRAHPLLCPYVPVISGEIIDDEYLAKNKEKIELAYSLLCDKKSKEVFKGSLDFFYTGRIEYLSKITSNKSEAFQNILRLKDENYLDLGAYDGDTIEEFLHYTDSYKNIVAVEPNYKNFEKLQKNIKNKDSLKAVKNCTIYNIGISDKSGSMFVPKSGGRQSMLSKALKDSSALNITNKNQNSTQTSNPASQREIAVKSVDELNFNATYIKADIEGMEEKMLNGAKNTLKNKPKLNLAAYHKTDDFFNLILKIHSINPDYKFYLRKHPYIPCWDLNLYCI